MHTRFEVDVRRAPGFGWSWRLFRIEQGDMAVAAVGRAPFRWMARVDARHFLRRHRATLAVGSRRPVLD